MSSFVFSGQGFASAELPLSPPFHPHSSLSDLFARCQLGVLVSAGAATCLSTSFYLTMERARRLTQSLELGFWGQIHGSH